MEKKPQSRRVHNLEELIELWPAILLHMKKRIGAAAVAYLHTAMPVAFNEEEIVLEYRDEFRFKIAIESSKRLPFDVILNECCVNAHRLRFQIAPYSAS